MKFQSTTIKEVAGILVEGNTGDYYQYSLDYNLHNKYKTNVIQYLESLGFQQVSVIEC